MKTLWVISVTLVTIVALYHGPASATDTITIIHAERLLDVESGKIESPALVVVKNRKIIAVNPKVLPVSSSDDTFQTVDLGDVTLLPGLIDTHTHITQDFTSADWSNAPLKLTAADQALLGAGNAKKTLAAGFTTIRDLGAYGFSDVALMHAIEKGIVDGPDIIASAHAIGITGGHCDITGLAPGHAHTGPRQGIGDGEAEILKAVRYQIKHGAKVIKTCATAGVLSMGAKMGAQQYSDQELQVLVEEAHRHGIKVAAHAHGAEGILAAANAGVDSIEHGTQLTLKTIKAMKKNHTVLVPTVYLIEVFDVNAVPELIRLKAQAVAKDAFASLRLAIKERLPIAYGTDAGVIAHGDNGKQFAVLVRHGMSRDEALRTATVNAAQLLGLNDRGAIKAGLRADIIAVPGNPLETIEVMESVSFVMKAGKIYSLAN